MQEKIEILLATYNGEQYIREQLDSILNQDYTNWIVRVCDDASTDNTYAVLMEYQKKFPDKFLIERNEKGFGSAKLNFFHLIKQSTADYVMCCDQDDVWLPNKISLTLEEMKCQETQNQKIQGRAMHDQATSDSVVHTGQEIPILIHTDLKVVNANLQVVSESFFEHSNLRKEFGYRDVLIQNHVTGCTVMMNRALVNLMNLENDYENILMHDWLAAIVAAGVGKIGFVDKPTMLYRQHAVNSVGAKKYGFALLVYKLKNNSIRKSLEDTTKQAGEVAKTYQGVLPPHLYTLTDKYAENFSRNKFYRIWFYVKYKVWKKGLPRQVWQLILG